MSTNQTTKKIAEIVSVILNPGVLAILILFMAIYKSHMPFNIALGWYIAVLVLNCIIPGLIYLFFTHHGYVFDDTLHNKHVHRERIILFGVFLSVTAVELLVMALTRQFYQPLFAVIIGGIVAIIIAGAVSYFWKVSMHSSMITFFTMMIVFIFGYQYWPVFLLIPLIWWARLVLYRHTIWQLFAGMFFSILIVLSTFYFFGLI